MKAGFEVFGAEALIRRLKEHPEKIGRAVDSVLVQEARGLCVSYGALSEPGGMSEGSGDQLRARVEGDVRTVFASRQDAGRVFALLNSRDPGLAKAYWHAYKSKDTRRMGQILTKAGLPQGIDPAALKRARTGAGKRVRRKGFVPVSLATEAQVRAFARKQKLLVGFAKAGWYAAARALGGRVRRNDTDAVTGKRTTAEIFPPYVRKLQRRFPGAGGARIQPGRVDIFTNVRHAEVALTEARYQQATAAAEASLAKSLGAAVAAVNKRFHTSKAAAA
jgi:hypothetical protein